MIYPRNPVAENDIVYRLKKRAEIRRQILTRKSVQENKPDRVSDLLEEAAAEIIRLREKLNPAPVGFVLPNMAPNPWIPVNKELWPSIIEQCNYVKPIYTSHGTHCNDATYVIGKRQYNFLFENDSSSSPFEITMMDIQ